MRDSVSPHGPHAGGRSAARGGGGGRLRRPGAAAAQGRERGADQNRTGVRGFAGLCLTTRPRRPRGRMVSGPTGHSRVPLGCGAVAVTSETFGAEAFEAEAVPPIRLRNLKRVITAIAVIVPFL